MDAKKQLDDLKKLRDKLSQNLASVQTSITDMLEKVFPRHTLDEYGFPPVGTWVRSSNSADFGQVIDSVGRDYSSKDAYGYGRLHTLGIPSVCTTKHTLTESGWVVYEVNDYRTSYSNPVLLPTIEGVDWSKMRYPSHGELYKKLDRDECQITCKHRGNGNQTTTTVGAHLKRDYYNQPMNRYIGIAEDGYGKDTKVYKYFERLSCPNDLGIAGMAWFTTEAENTRQRIPKMFAKWQTILTEETDREGNLVFNVEILPSIRKRG